MASRPVFIPNLNSKQPLVRTEAVEFEWFAGFSLQQKQRSIAALHAAAAEQDITRILEVSRKSTQDIGKLLSAFNLMVPVDLLSRSGIDTKQAISVENAFQGSKVFSNDVQYAELYHVKPIEAKKDARLRESGDLIKFKLGEQDYPATPTTIFYDFLYLSALLNSEKLTKSILEFSAFTDIEFNPKRSINCQARTVAVFVSLCKSSGINRDTSSTELWQTLEDVYSEQTHDQTGQMSLL